ncbi:MAG: hypothetical protein K2O81_01830, partial [Clostridia bacterium]|nr:hypothetical protein [Clostridia bacterium]
TIKDGLKDVTENYAVTYVYGDLEITAVEIGLTLRNVTKPYTGADIEITADEAIERVEILEDTNFTVTFGQAVVNAGTYAFNVDFADKQLAGNYVLKIDGSNVLTVTKLNLTVTLKDVEDAEYTGKAQTVTAANVINVGANVDGITATGLTFTYSEAMTDAGDYVYGAQLADETLRGNYNLIVTGGSYTIVPTEIEVTLKNYAETYSNTNFTIDVYDAIESIDGNCKALLGKSDFVPNYVNSLRLAGDYTYEVEIASVEKSKNFILSFNGGSFTINKRKLAIVFTELELTQDEFEELYGSDEYAPNFDVSACISLSTSTPVANGDSFRVISAFAEGLGYNMLLGLYTIDSYELTNNDCYDFVNLDGETPLTARLKIIG